MKHVDTLIPAYQDNMLTEKDRRMVEAHLAVCDTCRRHYAELVETIQAYAPSRTNKRLISEALSMMKPGNAIPKPYRTLRYVLVTAIPAAAAVVFIAVLPQLRTPRYDNAAVSAMFSADLFTREEMRSRGSDAVPVKHAVRAAYFLNYRSFTLNTDDRAFLNDIIAEHLHGSGIRMSNTAALDQYQQTLMRQFPSEYRTGQALWRCSYVLASSNAVHSDADIEMLTNIAGGKDVVAAMKALRPEDVKKRNEIRRRVVNILYQ